MTVSRLEPSDPAIIGPYLLLGRVASGGMGVVYLGREDGRPDSLVVVKTARPDHLDVSGEFVDRLRSEARVAAALAGSAPHVEGLARFVEADADGEDPWIATEYVPGPSLHDVARGRSLPDHDVASLAEMLAECIAMLHSGGYAHRDVKPANVVMGPDGARLVDLGLARRLDAPLERQVLGSPGWSPPEQRDLTGDPRPGDVHGWGMSVAYAACGRPAFGTGPGALVTRRMLTGAPRLGCVAEPLRELVTAALRPDPLSRPKAEDLVDALASSPRHFAGPVTGSRGAAAPTAAAEGLVALAPCTEEIAAPTLIEREAPSNKGRDTGEAVGDVRVRRPGRVAVAVCALLAMAALAVGTGVTSLGGTSSAASTPTPSARATPAVSPSARRPAAPTLAATVRRASSAPAPAPVPAPNGKGKHRGRKH